MEKWEQCNGLKIILFGLKRKYDFKKSERVCFFREILLFFCSIHCLFIAYGNLINDKQDLKSFLSETTLKSIPYFISMHDHFRISLDKRIPILDHNNYALQKALHNVKGNLISWKNGNNVTHSKLEALYPFFDTRENMMSRKVKE